MRRPSRVGAPRARVWCAALGVALSIACARGPKQEPPPPPFDPPAETLDFSFDGRDWKPALRQRVGAVGTEIFVLPGETTEEWTELVTRTLSYGAQRGANMEAILRAKKQALEKECPIVEWTVLEAERRSALYEWSRPFCKELAPQTEIGRFVFGRLGIHAVAYDAKTSRMASGLRRQWIESLGKAALAVQGEDTSSRTSSSR